jgi:branched-chain amino acid transport system permease protein
MIDPKQVARTRGIVLIGIALAMLPFVGATAATWVRVLDFALLYIMLALGLNIVVGFAGLLDLGYIAFYAVGAYLYALLSPRRTFRRCSHRAGLAGVGDAAAGRAGRRRVRRAARRADAALRGDYLAIVTLGFGEIVRIFMNNLNAPVNITNGPQGISQIDRCASPDIARRSIDLFGLRFPPSRSTTTCSSR